MSLLSFFCVHVYSRILVPYTPQIWSITSMFVLHTVSKCLKCFDTKVQTAKGFGSGVWLTCTNFKRANKKMTTHHEISCHPLKYCGALLNSGWQLISCWVVNPLLALLNLVCEPHLTHSTAKNPYLPSYTYHATPFTNT